MTVEVSAVVRRIKPERRRAQLRPRLLSRLVAAADLTEAGRTSVMLDTNVYIRSAAGTLPPSVRMLIDRGLLFHCAVCIAELMTGIANADPARVGWNRLRLHYEALVESFPPTRVLTPDPQTWVEAGLIAGTLARTQNFQPHQRKECLNDALIFLTSAKAGLPVLTANRDEFDLIQQLAPQGRFIHF